MPKSKEDVYGTQKKLKFIKKTIRNHCEINDKISILDVGCGTGQSITIPLGEAGYKILGVDIDEESIRLAVDSNPYSNVRFKAVDILKLANSFDVIIFSEVLEHLKKPEKFLATGEKLLKNDGIIIVTVPNGYGWFEIDDWLWRHLNIEKPLSRGYWIAKKNYWKCLPYNLLKKSVLGNMFIGFIRKVKGESHIETANSNMEKNGIGNTPSAKNTLNIDNRHIQFFSISALNKLYQASGLELIKVHNGTFLGGKIFHSLCGWDGAIFGYRKTFIEWNTKFANCLPSCFCSNWFFVLKKASRTSKRKDTGAKPHALFQ